MTEERRPSARQSRPAAGEDRAPRRPRSAGKRPSPGPTLETYFGDEPVPAAAFVAAVRASKAARFSDDDVAAARPLVERNDADGRRLLGLATQATLPAAIKAWIWGAVRQRIRMHLSEAADEQERDPARLLRRVGDVVAADLRRTKNDRADPMTLLHLALAWAMNQTALDASSAMEIIERALGQGQESDRTLRAILSGGKTVDLERAIAVANVVGMAVRDVTSQRDLERQQRASAQERLSEAQAEIASLRAEVSTLNAEKSRLAASLEERALRHDQDQQLLRHEMSEEQAQKRLFLTERIAPLLTDAVDALEIEPPAPQVSVKRLRTALRTIKEAQQ